MALRGDPWPLIPLTTTIDNPTLGTTHYEILVSESGSTFALPSASLAYLQWTRTGGPMVAICWILEKRIKSSLVPYFFVSFFGILNLFLEKLELFVQITTQH